MKSLLCLTIAFIALAPPLAAGVAAVDTPTTRALLVQQIDALFDDDPRFKGAIFGALVESLDTGEVWLERNADQLFVPASNQKIPVAATALATLGPDFRYVTRVRASGDIEDGVLNGHLILEGMGDPTFYYRFGSDPRAPFRHLAAQIKDAGITTVTGYVIGDDNAWDDQHIPAGITHEDMIQWYGAPFGALNINENYVDLMIHPPDAQWELPVKIAPNLPSEYFTIRNELKTKLAGEHEVEVTRAFDSNEIVVRGQVVVGREPFERSPSLVNPTLYAATVFMEVLEHEGIEVRGPASDIDDAWKPLLAAPSTYLAKHESPPLSEILAVFLKSSQNMYAEVLVHTLGMHRDGVGNFEGGKTLIQDFLRTQFGIQPEDYVFVDGSGQSRLNLQTPRQVVTMFKGMRQREDLWPVWWEALTIAGVDGTLARRMKGTPAEGNVRGKTGTLPNTRQVSGYVTTADGENLVFSFMINNHTTTREATEDVIDGAAVLLAGYSEELGPEE
ncbi:MAG: D-alanyl-D-alanine carboxypeptidase/D-alanyl-D-alanine-endopeptidase [Sumerlaeia bacterium]